MIDTLGLMLAAKRITKIKRNKETKFNEVKDKTANKKDAGGKN